MNQENMNISTGSGLLRSNPGQGHHFGQIPSMEALANFQTSNDAINALINALSASGGTYEHTIDVAVTHADDDPEGVIEMLSGVLETAQGIDEISKP